MCFCMSRWAAAVSCCALCGLLLANCERVLLSQAAPGLSSSLARPLAQHALCACCSPLLQCRAASFLSRPPPAMSPQVEALLRLQHYRAAMECLLAARERHPAFAQTDDYQRTVADIQQALEESGAT